MRTTADRGSCSAGRGGAEARSRWSNRIGVALAGPALVGAAVFGTASTGPIGPSGHSHRDIAPTASFLPASGMTGTGIGSFPQFLLDNLFQIGQKTIAELFANPLTGASPTLGGLLGWLGLSTDDQFSTVFEHLGFQNLTIGSILNGLGFPDTETVEQAAEHLNQLMGGIGLVNGSTLAELLHAFDTSIGSSTAADLTLEQVLTQINVNPTEPLNEILDDLRLGPDPADTLGNATVAELMNELLRPGETAVPNPPGVEDSTTLIDYLTGIGIHPDLTIDQLLGLDPSVAL